MQLQADLRMYLLYHISEKNQVISLIILLFFLLAVMDASAAVKKKRFDVGGGEAPAETEMVAPAEGASAVPAAVPKKTVEKTRSFYTVIAEEQKVLREKLTAAISAMKSGDWGAIWKFLLICLVYGMLHALGPGHGKSIVVGYFIARRGRWRQGVALGAQVLGFVDGGAVFGIQGENFVNQRQLCVLELLLDVFLYYLRIFS